MAATHPHPVGWPETWAPTVAAMLLAVAYTLLARRARLRHPARGWPRRRTASFLAGAALAALALSPPLAPYAHGDFRGHMLQHLLTGMYAPIALVLGAPVTLLLRTLTTRRARLLAHALHSRPLALLARPAVALTLSTGSLPVLYFTSLYDATMDRPLAHWLLHAHFLLSGCLFAWVIAGPDPAPVRPGVPARLVVLGVAIAAHATVSQLMYAGFLVHVHAPFAQVQGGAEIMYYGGDIAELLLAAALVTTWRPVPTATRAAEPTAPTRQTRPPAIAERTPAPAPTAPGRRIVGHPASRRAPRRPMAPRTEGPRRETGSAVWFRGKRQR